MIAFSISLLPFEIEVETKNVLKKVAKAHQALADCLEELVKINLLNKKK